MLLLVRKLDKRPEKASLRRLLLEKRDSTSYEFTQISSKKIQKKLQKLDFFREAKTIGAYYSIGSEISTKNILQDILNDAKDLSLPKLIDDNLIFKKISSLKDLEKGSFSILEPKENCADTSDLDVILVPSIAMTRNGQRLGYGYGYYDRYLSSTKSKTIALTYSKQIVKHIPETENDVRIDYIITENETLDTSKS